MLDIVYWFSLFVYLENQFLVANNIGYIWFETGLTQTREKNIIMMKVKENMDKGLKRKMIKRGIQEEREGGKGRNNQRRK